MSSPVAQYVILPPRATRGGTLSSSATAEAFLTSLEAPHALNTAFAVPDGSSFRVLDSIDRAGAKLIEADAESVSAIRAAQPDLMIAPVVYYDIARRPAFRAFPVQSVATTAALAAVGRVAVTVRDARTGAGVPRATVVAFTNFTTRTGASGVTGADGVAKLQFSATPVTVERLIVVPPLAGYWGASLRNQVLNSTVDLRLEPIREDLVDGLRHFYGEADLTVGNGVLVAVIDTGVGPHPDVRSEGDIDNGAGHGTHVAGIIAGRGIHRGVAPGARIRSYRVFSQPGGLAANFTIAKAIDQAIADGCDIINLSLKIDNSQFPGGFFVDPVVQSALVSAREAGVLPIGAAGNDSRTAVDFPGRDAQCLAVTALGRRGTFPVNSLEEMDVLGPFGTDPNNFIGAFSNMGSEVDLTAPGVGVVSTVPGGYGVMSGTSMACPAAVGIAARLLSSSADLMAMPRDANRATELARRLLQNAQSLGFPVQLEGRGLAR